MKTEEAKKKKTQQKNDPLNLCQLGGWRKEKGTRLALPVELSVSLMPFSFSVGTAR